MNHLQILQFYIKERNREKLNEKIERQTDRQTEREREKLTENHSCNQSRFFFTFWVCCCVCVRRCVCLFWKLNNNNIFDCCDIQRSIEWRRFEVHWTMNKTRQIFCLRFVILQVF